MDRLILGDNQFFGVSHMSEERGIERMRRFQNLEAIIEILDLAYDSGIHAFTFSTHDRVRLLCDHFRAHPERYADLRLYPALPYAHKYAHAVNEKGVVGALKDVMAGIRAKQVASMFARGSAALLTQDPIQIMKLLVDAELLMFRGLDVRIVFLQSIVTDLMLGLGFEDVFPSFVAHVEGKYGVRAGFMTLNMPRLVDFLLARGIKDPVVCSAINKSGFQMNPDVATYERALRTKPFQALAMSVMAAGALPPREAFEYVAGLKEVKSILFGASTKAHLEETKAVFEQAN